MPELIIMVNDERYMHVGDHGPSPLFAIDAVTDTQGPMSFSLDHLAAIMPVVIPRAVAGGLATAPDSMVQGQPLMIDGPGVMVFVAGGRVQIPLPQGVDPQDVISACEAAKRAWVDR